MLPPGVVAWSGVVGVVRPGDWGGPIGVRSARSHSGASGGRIAAAGFARRLAPTDCRPEAPPLARPSLTPDGFDQPARSRAVGADSAGCEVEIPVDGGNISVTDRGTDALRESGATVAG